MFKLKHIPLTLCGAFVLKTLILGVSWSEASVILGLAGLSFLYEKYSTDGRFKEVDDKLSEMNSRLAVKEKELDELRTHMGGIKTALNVKQGMSKAGW